MKYLIVVLALVAHVTCEVDWTKKTLEDIKAIRAECRTAYPLTEEQSEKLKSFEFPNEDQVHQYILCYANKMGIFADDNGYNVNRIVGQFKLQMDEAEVMEIAKGCADQNEQKDSAQVWAYRGHKCLMNSKVGDAIKELAKKLREMGKL